MFLQVHFAMRYPSSGPRGLRTKILRTKMVDVGVERYHTHTEISLGKYLSCLLNVAKVMALIPPLVHPSIQPSIRAEDACDYTCDYDIDHRFARVDKPLASERN